MVASTEAVFKSSVFTATLVHTNTATAECNTKRKNKNRDSTDKLQTSALLWNLLAGGFKASNCHLPISKPFPECKRKRAHNSHVSWWGFLPGQSAATAKDLLLCTLAKEAQCQTHGVYSTPTQHTPSSRQGFFLKETSRIYSSVTFLNFCKIPKLYFDINESTPFCQKLKL